MFQQSFTRFSTAALFALMLTGFLSLSGCGDGKPMGTVSGRVTFKGDSVSEGRITFEGEKNTDAELSSDGSYTLKSPLPIGDYKITITPMIERRQVDGRGPVVGVEKNAPNIPQKYWTSASSRLTATVKEGKNEGVDFDMKP